MRRGVGWIVETLSWVVVATQVVRIPFLVYEIHKISKEVGGRKNKDNYSLFLFLWIRLGERLDSLVQVLSPIIP